MKEETKLNMVMGLFGLAAVLNGLLLVMKYRDGEKDLFFNLVTFILTTVVTTVLIVRKIKGNRK